jgi:hypothetical protein
MNIHHARMVLLVVIAWLLALATAVMSSTAENSLVGVRSRQDDAAGLLAPAADLDSARAKLESINLWGLQRDGKPLPATGTAGGDAKPKPPEWRFLASVVRQGGERRLIVLVDRKEVKSFSIGDELPDGTVVADIGTEGYALKSAEGELRRIQTYVQ